jgi:hypothetical protein
MGALPDFIDGHQHVHHLPQVRQALLQVYQDYYPNKTAWIRISAQPHFLQNCRSMKQAIIAYSGAVALRKMLEHRGIPHNTSFAGIYDFAPHSDYAALLNRFIAESQEGGLIMCHPALTEDESSDAIYQSRVQEYQVISQAAFL